MKYLSYLTVATAAFGLVAGATAAASDFTGAWASDASACNKIFTKKGNTITFSSRSELDGNGVIIDKNQIRGRDARCRITSQKVDGDTIHLLASCSSDIMLSSVQFSIKMKDDNHFIRLFPGMEGLEIPYERCP